MPIYEYQCRQCGHRLDALQKMSDPLLEDCPRCAQPRLRKLLSAPHFRLKGSGWYETDFKNSGREKPTDSGSSGAGDEKSKPAAGENGKASAKGAAETSSGKDSAKSAASGASADSS